MIFFKHFKVTPTEYLLPYKFDNLSCICYFRFLPTHLYMWLYTRLLGETRDVQVASFQVLLWDWRSYTYFCLEGIPHGWCNTSMHILQSFTCFPVRHGLTGILRACGYAFTTIIKVEISDITYFCFVKFLMA